MRDELRVVLQLGERAGPSAFDQIQVLGQPGELEVGHAGLLRVEQRSLSAQAATLQPANGPGFATATSPVGRAAARAKLAAQTGVMLVQTRFLRWTPTYKIALVNGSSVKINDLRIREDSAVGTDPASRGRAAFSASDISRIESQEYSRARTLFLVSAFASTILGIDLYMVGHR